MAREITKQFPMDPAPTTNAYARHEGAVHWGRKGQPQAGHIFFTVYKSEAARQAENVGGIEHQISVPVSSTDEATQALIDDRNAAIDLLKKADYALAKLLDPAFAAGTDLL
jgi:hypothetical protein